MQLSKDILLRRYEERQKINDQIISWFEDNHDEYFCKDHYHSGISIRKAHPDNNISALLKLYELSGKTIEGAEHDKVFLCMINDLSEKTTEDDVKYLLSCGVCCDMDDYNEGLILLT